MSIYRIDAYLVASEDAHSSEYVSEADERRAYISGFTGSAGTVIVTAKESLLWTDSRYFLQAEAQLGLKAEGGSKWKLMRMHDPGVPEIETWVADNLAGKKIGIDANLLPADRVEGWRSKTWRVKGVTVECLPGNLIDCLWVDRPTDPRNEITIHPEYLSGQPVASKLARVREEVAKAKAGALVLNALDQIAWLFNLRGSDIECNPVFFAYSVVTVGVNGAAGNAYLFLRLLDEANDDANADDLDVAAGAAARATNVSAILTHLAGTGVELRPYESFTEVLPGLLLQAAAVEADAAVAAAAGGKEEVVIAPFGVMAERGTCNLAISTAITEARRHAEEGARDAAAGSGWRGSLSVKTVMVDTRWVGSKCSQCSQCSQCSEVSGLSGLSGLPVYTVYTVFQTRTTLDLLDLL
jgi:Xaa-Pro aminopeptidase